MVKKYGNWANTAGKLEEMPPEWIEEIKSLLYEQATEDMEKEKVDIREQSIQWVIKQMYRDDSGHTSTELFDGAVPYVTIGWKMEVDTNG